MKNLIVVTSLALQITTINAQTGKVGINTNTPTRNLDVNGNLGIRNLEIESDNSNYSKILVANANGDIDYALKKDFLPSPMPDDAAKEVFNSIYNMSTNTSDNTKKVNCGKFTFLFENDNENTDIRFHLNKKPDASVNIYVSMEQNWSTSGFEFFQGTTSNDADKDKAFNFTIDNWNVAKDFAASNVADYEQNTIHLQYPADPTFYRLTIYKVKQQNSWDFVTVCEKF